MDNKFSPKNVVEAIYKRNEARHKEAAKLPIEEKIKLMVNMQKALNGFNKRKEKKYKVWEI